jgi:HAMP domain/His Kinase A (phospho-acceptor) domain
MRRIWAQLRRLWPTRLAGQLIALLLLALILAQAISLWIFLDERRVAVQSANRLQILSRTASIVRLLEDTPENLHEQILRTASTPALRFWLADASAVDPTQAENRDNRLQQVLAGHLAGVGVEEVLVDWQDDDGGWGDWWRAPESRRALIRPVGDADARTRDDARDQVRTDNRQWPGDRRWRHPRLPPNLVISAHLGDGRWLNVGTRLPPPNSDWAMPGLVSMAVMAVALFVIVIFMVRRLTRPMAELAVAAERLGRGEAVPPVPERGPVDVRETTRAFNRMHARLQRFVQDRTRMLAAISHDLRTPITSLRLRAEFIEDEEIRQKILENPGRHAADGRGDPGVRTRGGGAGGHPTGRPRGTDRERVRRSGRHRPGRHLRRRRAQPLSRAALQPEAGAAQPDRERRGLWAACARRARDRPP